MISKIKPAGWFAAQATEEEFEQFYHLQLPKVYNFFRYRFGDGPLAEDLTSETFEKAWRHRGRYKRDLGGLSTWIFTIARNLAVDQYRKKEQETPLNEAADLPSDEMPMDELVQQRTDHARLSILLARLTDRERELVALKYGAGLTNRTIAGITGLSESNVAVILYRAVQSLRGEWEKP
jgi:RNA polymerase sigma-70 factor (ECF subfamily)